MSLQPPHTSPPFYITKWPRVHLLHHQTAAQLWSPCSWHSSWVQQVLNLRSDVVTLATKALYCSFLLRRGSLLGYVAVSMGKELSAFRKKVTASNIRAQYPWRDETSLTPINGTTDYALSCARTHTVTHNTVNYESIIPGGQLALVTNLVPWNRIFMDPQYGLSRLWRTQFRGAS